jgi:hypothetical protein
MFSKISILLATAMTMPLAAFGQQIVTYHGYASTVSCSGDNFQCTDGGAVCCSFPTGFTFSAQWDNLPSGTQGQGYTNGVCTAFLFSVFGPGTKCWNGGGSSFQTLDWFHSPQKRDADPKSECVGASLFEYTDPTSGEVRGIKVPGGGKNLTEAEVIADLRLKNDFASLEKYERAY